MEINDWARMNIKKQRKLAKMTQKEFADCLQVKHSTVSLWETGKIPISLIRLDQICEIFHMTVEDLIFDEIEFPLPPPTTETEGEEKDILVENMKNRPEIRELYKVSIGCEPKDVIVVTNVLYDLG